MRSMRTDKVKEDILLWPDNKLVPAVLPMCAETLTGDN